MRILVCIKEIQDPEIAASVFRVDEQRKEPKPLDGLPLVTSPFDEQAVEAALRIRDRGCECQITVVTFGPDEALRAIKRALSMGADDGIRISNVGMERVDSVATAHVLSKAIRQLGQFDLILAGRQAADWDAGIVGCGIAELLRIPAVTFAKSVQIEDRRVVVERVLDDGFETVEAPMPCLVTVSNELGEPRKATLRETMRAAKKPTLTHSLESIGVKPDSLARPQERERLFVPSREIKCEFVTGDSAQEMAQQIVSRLSATKLV
jgi:electron transfer flavoprotein beta subunit